MSCQCKQCQVMRIFVGQDERFSTIGEDRAVLAIEAVGGVLAGMLSCCSPEATASSLNQIALIALGYHPQAQQVVGHA